MDFRYFFDFLLIFLREKLRNFTRQTRVVKNKYSLSSDENFEKYWSLAFVDRLRLLDGRSEPRAAVDMGEQRAASGAQRLDEARGPDHRVRTVLTPYPQRSN